MGFYAGDTYRFILNLATTTGTPVVTSAPVITVLDITNPGSPIVSGAAMILVAGTSFVYYYSFAAPNSSPNDYVALYSYAVKNTQSAGTATLASWGNSIASYTFPLPLPVNTIPGSQLTTTGFVPSGFNVTAQTIQSADPKTGVVKVALIGNPGTIESFNLTGNAQVVAGIPNVATVQVTQITNGQISPGDSITIAAATTGSLNGSWTVNTAVLSLGVWTVTFYTSGSTFSSAAQSAGTLTDSATSLASTFGSGSAITNVTISNQRASLKDELHIGDSFITGQVALNATVAQNSTVAKDATVFKASSYVAPSNDPTVQTINTSVATILANSTTEVALLGTLAQGTVAGLLQDVYDNLFGSWSIDQTVVPPVLYIKRINGTVIASFQLVNNNSVTQRNVVTNPPESSI